VKRKEILEHTGVVGVRTEIKKRKVNALILDSLIFIEKMFELGDTQLTSKFVGIALSTGYGWLKKRGDEEGLNGLILKYME